MPTKPRLSTRIARSKVPVNPTLNPAMNAPAWLATVMTALAVLPTDWPVWAKVVVIVVGLAVGVATQFLTTPARDAADHGDAPLDGD